MFKKISARMPLADYSQSFYCDCLNSVYNHFNSVKKSLPKSELNAVNISGYAPRAGLCPGKWCGSQRPPYPFISLE